MRSFSVVLVPAKRDVDGFFKVLLLSSHLLISRHPVQKSKFGACAVTGYCSLSSKFITRVYLTPYNLRNMVNKLSEPLLRTKTFKHCSNRVSVIVEHYCSRHRHCQVSNQVFVAAIPRVRWFFTQLSCKAYPDSRAGADPHRSLPFYEKRSDFS